MRFNKVFLMAMMGIFIVGLYPAFGQNYLGMPVTKHFPVTELKDNEIHPATAYNILRDEFIVVWQDDRNGTQDLYGRIYKSDGTSVGNEFVVSSGSAQKLYPAVAYNRLQDEYMVVWQNMGDMGNDIYGIRLDFTGKKVWSPRSQADTSFVVCDHSWCQYHPKIAHNYADDTYLVVWHDFRNVDASDMDIYGQRLDWNADLLLPVEPPAESPATEINFPLSRGMGLTIQVWDAYCDVAYHGPEGEGGPLNEWLVVWSRSMHTLQIWGVRVNGKDGVLLDTWGRKTDLPSTSKSLTGGEPPWLPEFVIGYYTGKDQGSGHVEANAEWWPFGIGKNNRGYTYHIPEFLVAWTDFRRELPDIYCQRIAYFPDSTAYRMGLKPNREADSLWTAVPLDSAGRPADEFFQWLTWENYPVTTNTGYQSWNDLTYNQNNGEYLVVWNDWREQAYAGSEDPAPPADIYGQRLYLNPCDSALLWLDDDGNIIQDRTLNTPIANTRTPDEGNKYYPAPDHGIIANAFFIAYEYEDDIPADDDSIDVHAAFYAGTPFVGGVVRIDVLPAEVDMFPGQEQQFEAHGFDCIGFEIYLLATWSADGGEITQAGVYTAPEELGDYTITASTEDGAVTGTAIVHVTAPLDSIAVTPAEVDLNPGEQQQFQARGFDTQGTEMAITPIWSTDGGDITQDGLYTAGDVGEFTITVSVDGSSVTGTTAVRVWPTGVDATGRVPNQFRLSQNYPNPFNSESTILFDVKSRSRVVLKVYDLQGHEVMTLVDDDYAPGTYRVKLNSSDIASGIYLYHITMGGFQAVRKMVVLE